MKKVFYKLEKDNPVAFEDFKNEYAKFIKEKLKNTKLKDSQIERFLFSKPEDVIRDVKDNKLPETDELKYAFISNSNRQDDFHNYRDKILHMFDITVCPYCNRNYYLSYNENKNTKNFRVMFELDHFYPKESYGYLSLNIYNFVPSCGNCNSFKSDTENGILNPHYHSFDDYVKFELDHKDVNSIMGNNSNFEIEVSVKEKDPDISMQCKKTIKTFKIDKIYKNHKRDVQDILRKKQLYTNELKADLEAIIKGKNHTFPNISIDEFIFNTSDDINNVSLAKFRKDILDFVNANYKEKKKVNKKR